MLAHHHRYAAGQTQTIKLNALVQADDVNAMQQPEGGVMAAHMYKGTSNFSLSDEQGNHS